MSTDETICTNDYLSSGTADPLFYERTFRVSNETTHLAAFAGCGVLLFLRLFPRCSTIIEP